MLPMHSGMTRVFQEDREREIAALRALGRRPYATKPAAATGRWLAGAWRGLHQARPTSGPVGRPERVRSYRPS